MLSAVRKLVPVAGLEPASTFGVFCTIRCRTSLKREATYWPLTEHTGIN